MDLLRRAARLGALGAASGGIAVLAGAFGAHALRDHLEPRALEVFETAVRWQAVHALALLATAILATGAIGERAPRAVRLAGLSFVVGTVLFSGSLYALALSGVKGLGAITPFGGVAFVVGWGALAAAFARGGADRPGGDGAGPARPPR